MFILFLFVCLLLFLFLLQKISPGYLKTVFVPKLPKRRLRVADTARAGPGGGIIRNVETIYKYKFKYREFKSANLNTENTNTARAGPGGGIIRNAEKNKNSNTENTRAGPGRGSFEMFLNLFYNFAQR